MDEREAAHSLEALRTARVALAERARWSVGRHAAFGLVSGGLIAGYALPGALPVIGAAACLAATGMIVLWDRRRDGFFVNGYRPGRTRGLTFALLAIELAALASAIVLKMRYSLDWAPLAIGSGIAILATIASIAWERIYRRELNGAGDAR